MCRAFVLACSVGVLAACAAAVDGEVGAGNAHSCARVGARVRCWGDDRFGQLGRGVIGDAGFGPWIEGLGEVVRLAVGGDSACALDSAGVVRCWGSNIYGELGDRTTISRGAPAPVPGLPPIVDVAAGFGHACALAAGGEVWCWGWSGGDQANEGDPSVARVRTTVQGARSLRAGYAAACALGEDRASCWGAVPDEFAAGEVRDVVLAVSTVCAVRRDHLECFGEHLGFQGEALDGPARYPLPDASSASGAGIDHACVAADRGRVYCLGKNDHGQLGGSYEWQRAPVRVADLEDVSSVAAGAAHSCVWTRGGRVLCWGSNSFLQLGDPSGADSLIPYEVELPGR